MIDLSDNYLLQIEPDQEGEPSLEPVEDELTEKIKFIFSTCEKGARYKGWHTTKYGKGSDTCDYITPTDHITNSLCVHYVQLYRPYIPQSEIDKINSIYDAIKDDPEWEKERLERKSFELYVDINNFLAYEEELGEKYEEIRRKLSRVGIRNISDRDLEKLLEKIRSREFSIQKNWAEVSYQVITGGNPYDSTWGAVLKIEEQRRRFERFYSNLKEGQRYISNRSISAESPVDEGETHIPKDSVVRVADISPRSEKVLIEWRGQKQWYTATFFVGSFTLTKKTQEDVDKEKELELSGATSRMSFKRKKS